MRVCKRDITTKLEGNGGSAENLQEWHLKSSSAHTENGAFRKVRQILCKSPFRSEYFDAREGMSSQNIHIKLFLMHHKTCLEGFVKMVPYWWKALLVLISSIYGHPTYY